MGIARGTNIITDGLAFGYDTGHGVADNNTATRFYSGKPTTNLLSSTEAFDDTNYWARSRNSGSAPTVTANTSPNPLGGTYTSKADKVYIPDDGTYPRIAQNFTPASTNTHHFSVWIRSLSGACGIFLGIFRNSPWSLPGQTTIGSDQITAEWKRFSFSFTPADTSSHQIYMGAHDAAAHKGNTLEFWGAQIEEESDRTPYTASSRSNTNSLIDLKRTTSVSLANVSFNSTGQPDFDGTNDSITVNNVGIDNYSEAFSYECVFKAEGTWANSYISNIVGINGSYSGHYGLGKSGTNTIQFVIRDASYSAITGTVSDVSTYHHLVGVWDQSNSQMRLYIDGELASSASSITKTGAPDSNDLRIGGRAAFGGDNGTYYDGVIPVVKYYKAALTAGEVTQNFNAYKNRFNI